MNGGEIIYSVLSGDATLATLLGDSSSTAGMNKIFSMLAPQKEQAPFIVFHLISEVPDNCASGTKVRNSFVQVDVWGNTPDQMWNLSNRVIELLNQKSGTIATHNVDNILLENQQESPEQGTDPPLFGSQMEFKIRVVL